MPKGHQELQADMKAYFQAGLTAFEKGDYNAAHHAFSDVLGLDPQHFEAVHYLARCAVKRDCWSFAAMLYVELKSSAYAKSHPELDTEINVLVSMLSFLSFRRLAALPRNPVTLKELDLGLGLANGAMEYVRLSQRLGHDSPYANFATLTQQSYLNKKKEALTQHNIEQFCNDVQAIFDQKISSADDYNNAIKDLLALRWQAHAFYPGDVELLRRVNLAISSIEAQTRLLRYNDLRITLPTLLSLEISQMNTTAFRSHREMLKLKLIMVDELLVNVEVFDERQQSELAYFKNDLEACIEKTGHQKQQQKMAVSYLNKLEGIPRPDTLSPADYTSWLKQLHQLKGEIPADGFQSIQDAVSLLINDYENILAKRIALNLLTLAYKQSKDNTRFSDLDARRVKAVLNDVNNRPMSPELRQVLINMKRGTLQQKIDALVLTLNGFVKTTQSTWFASTPPNRLTESFESEAPEKIIATLQAP